MLTTRHVSAALLILVACGPARSLPPRPAPEASATFVSARFDLTWDAAIAHLDGAGVPIEDVERSAGLIVTGRVAVGPSEAAEFAACGSSSAGGGYLASSVSYRVDVQDDGSASWVLVTASWEAADSDPPFACETTRVWENELQEAIRLTAEVNR